MSEIKYKHGVPYFEKDGKKYAYFIFNDMLTGQPVKHKDYELHKGYKTILEVFKDKKSKPL